MSDRARNRDSRGAASEHHRTGVFRRPKPESSPDEIKRLYRPGPDSSSRSARRPEDEPRQRSAAAAPGRQRRPPRGRSRVYDGTGAKRRERERRRRRRRGIGVLLLVVLLVLPTAFYVWADSRLQRVEALTDYEGRPAEQPGTTYMIVGSDSREGLSEEDMRDLRTGDAQGKRTDTIMLLYVPENGEPTLLSVPRDSYVPIPEIGENKINAAFAENLGGGPARLARTFEQASGVRVDHYVEVGFSGFVGIVDALGGVEMCPEEPMADPKAGLDIEAGCQTFDGATALGYVRTRASPRADLARVERQREFFGALMDKATSAGVMANPFRVVPLVNEGTDTFEVGEDEHLHHLARMALAMRGDLTMSTVPVGSTPTIAGAGSVVLWDETRSAEMFDAMRAGEPIPESAMD